MFSVTENASPPRESLALPRFLALILFTGALFFGIGAVGSAAAAMTGERRAVGMSVGVGLSAWMLGWLGMVLWSGRSIPRWFIASFGIVIVAGPVVAVSFSGTWMEALTMVGMVVPGALGFQSVLRNYPGTPPKPKTFDEL